ncbi:MAG: GNAT family N-acetyltransferase [Bacteroidota bacterium]
MELVAAPPSTASGPPGLRIERLGLDRFGEIRAINHAVFGTGHVIQRLDRDDLLLLLAVAAGEPVGFKVGYGESAATFYSAKGGVIDGWRRQGIARVLLVRMEAEARAMGYRRLAFDTFPNKHPGMTVFGLAEHFKVTAAGYNAAYRDYRLRFERKL